MKKCRKAEMIIKEACTPRGEKVSFCPLTSTPAHLSSEIDRYAHAGQGLRAAYLAGVEFARAAIACSLGKPEIFRNPTAEEIASPNWDKFR